MESFGKLKPLSFDPVGESGPVLASANTPWAGIPFEVHDLPAFDDPFETIPPPGERGITVTLEGARTVVCQRGRRQMQCVSRPGMVVFSEGGVPAPIMRTIGTGRSVVINLPQSWHEVLLADGGPESFDVPPVPHHETARALALTLCSEVESGATTGALFAESLSFALLRYVLESSIPTRMRVRGGLSAGQCRRLLRYIDDHLREDIRLTELAAFTGLSLRHFSTVFRRAFGVSPHRYLLTRRLEQASRLLAIAGTDIAQIALHLGFSSQSHFSAAFRKQYGVSPRRYALSRRRSSSG